MASFQRSRGEGDTQCFAAKVPLAIARVISHQNFIFAMNPQLRAEGCPGPLRETAGSVRLHGRRSPRFVRQQQPDT